MSGMTAMGRDSRLKMSGMTRKMKDVGNDEGERFPTENFGNDGEDERC